jgi:hypothetical protein
LIDPGVVLVATVRQDGTPRLSPVEPFILDGDLWLSMMWQSAKARDLLRDPRILVHSVVTSRDGAEGEFKVRGTSRLEGDGAVQRRYAAAVAASLGWRPEPGRFHLFAIDISHVSYLTYDSATGDQRVAMWPPGRKFIRRATSATSVGDPEPISDITVELDRTAVAGVGGLHQQAARHCHRRHHTKVGRSTPGGLTRTGVEHAGVAIRTGAAAWNTPKTTERPAPAWSIAASRRTPRRPRWPGLGWRPGGAAGCNTGRRPAF